MSPAPPVDWEPLRQFTEALAALLARYHADLVEAGLTRNEALSLTAGLQRDMMGAVMVAGVLQTAPRPAGAE